MALVVTASATVCRADDSAAAQALFDQGKTAMAAHDFARACPKFEESLHLEYGLGTLLNLADCYEHEGKLASAWSKFLELAAKARTAGQSDRARIGRDRAAALAPKLSNLEIDVPGPSKIDGLVIQRDGTDVGPAEWAAPIPADAGPHRIAASAPGRQPWSSTVTVSEGATTAKITVPLLTPLPPQPVAKRENAPNSNVSTEPLPTNPTETRSSSGGLGTARILAIASAAVGLGGVGVGSYFGLLSLAKHHDAQNDTLSGGCTPHGSQVECSGPGAGTAVNYGNEARSAGTISTIGFIVGGVGIAGAAALWFAAPKSEHGAAPSAQLGVGLGSVQLRGTF